VLVNKKLRVQFAGRISLFVAQVSNLLYRGFPIRNCSLRRARPEKTTGAPLRGPVVCLTIHQNLEPADWKSAIQQAGSLRYELARPKSDLRHEACQTKPCAFSENMGEYTLPP
jgi:hypothetical protein